MNNFIYDTPTKIYFGKAQEQNIGSILSGYNPNKVLIHYGCGSARKSGLLDRIEKSVSAAGIPFIELGGVTANPSLSLVCQGISLCLKNDVDFVLAVGGGSVIDSAKAIANGVANPDMDIWDICLGKATPQKTLNKAAVLTISAAGSEMSNSCVITNPDTNEKRGYNCSCNRLNFAIENPELTYSVGKYQTACGAVDIAMHTLERFFSRGESTYLTDSIALSVVKSVIKAGNTCLKDPYDYDSRANMMWASSLAHNDLTHCGREFTMPVHQLGHEICGKYSQVAHAAGLSALWCSWARYVYRFSMPRWLLFASQIWSIDIDYEHPEESVESAILTQENYYKSIGMPISIRELGINESDLESFALGCSRNKTRTIPGYYPLSYQEMLDIYIMSYNNI